MFINGDWIGFIEDPVFIINTIKEARENGIINIHTSVSWDQQNYIVNVYSDSGRPIRPLLVIENKDILFNQNISDRLKENKCNWYDLVSKIKSDKDYCIQYIDPHETNNCIIAMNIDDVKSKKKNEYTHL